MKTALWDDLHVSRGKAEHLEARLRRQAVEDEVGNIRPACLRVQDSRGKFNCFQRLVVEGRPSNTLATGSSFARVCPGSADGAQHLHQSMKYCINMFIVQEWCPLAFSGSRTSALTERESRSGRKTSWGPRKRLPGSASTSRDR